MERLILRDAQRTPLERSLPRLKSLVSPLTGIIPFTQQLLPNTDDARLFHIASVLGDTDALIGSPANRYNGGIHSTYDGALAAAIGEGIERYAGAYLDADRVRLASAAELGDEAAPPGSFALFHDRQYAEPTFPFARFTEQTRIRWTCAYRLPDGVRAYVPTQLSNLGPCHGEPQVGYATSSGMACGATLEEAILSGLLELVERDAFLLTWYNALSLPLLDWSADRAVLEEERRFFHATGLPYCAVDLSGFLGVPTALGVVRDGVGDVALAVGCASATTMREAVCKALREAFQTRAFGRQLRADRPGWRCDGDFRSIDDFEDHVLFYAFADGARQAAFVDASPRRVRVDEVAPLEGASVTDRIHAILRRLARVGAHAFVVDNTPPDLEAAGIRAVAVVVPELCRLDVPYRFRYLGGRRLYHAAHEAGLAPRPLAFENLNPLPHPFP